MKNKKIITVTVTLFILLFIVGIFIIKNANRDEGANERSADASILLTINTDKYRYTPGEEVYIQIASLDANGIILCDSNLELSVSNYNIQNSIFYIPVSPSSTCSMENSYSNSPDYSAFFKPESDGVYKLTLTNKDLNQQTWAEFTVDSNPPDIEVVRWSATRIDLVEKPHYPMVITVTSNKNFSGTVTDSLPAGFTFSWYGDGLVDELNGSKTITWNVNLNAGKSVELKYEYVPEVSNSCVFSFGPITVSGNATYSTWKVTPNKECVPVSSLDQGINLMYRSKMHYLSTNLSLNKAVFI